MELQGSVARFRVEHPGKCAALLAAACALIASGAFLDWSQGRHFVSLLVAAQILLLAVVAKWVLGSPEFKNALKVPEELEGIPACSDAILDFRARIQLPGRPCLSKVAFASAWALLGLAYGGITLTAIGIPIGVSADLAATWLFIGGAYLLCMFSFWYCFAYAQLLTDLAAVAEEGSLPYYPAAPSQTSWYGAMESGAKWMGMNFLLTSLLFLLACSALATYGDLTMASMEASTEGYARPEWFNMLRNLGFLLAVFPGLPSFFVLHGLTSSALSRMLDAFERRTLRIVQKGTELTEWNVRQQLAAYERINRVTAEVRRRRGFEQVDAATIALGVLTLVVAILTLTSSVKVEVLRAALASLP